MSDLLPILWTLIAAAGVFFGMLIGYAVGFYIGYARSTERWCYTPCYRCGTMPRRDDQ